MSIGATLDSLQKGLEFLTVFTKVLIITESCLQRSSWMWSSWITLPGSSVLQGRIPLPESRVCSLYVHPLCCQLFCSYRLQSAGWFHSRVATSRGKKSSDTCGKAQVFPSSWDGFRLLFLLVPRLSIWLGSICTYFSFISRSFLRPECMNIMFALFWSYSFLLAPSTSPHSSNSWWPFLLFIVTLTDIPGETDTEIERDTILTYMYIYKYSLLDAFGVIHMHISSCPVGIG